MGYAHLFAEFLAHLLVCLFACLLVSFLLVFFFSLLPFLFISLHSLGLLSEQTVE